MHRLFDRARRITDILQRLNAKLNKVFIQLDKKVYPTNSL